MCYGIWLYRTNRVMGGRVTWFGVELLTDGERRKIDFCPGEGIMGISYGEGKVR